MGFDVRGVNHLYVRNTALAGKLSEQVFPNSTPCPAYKAIIDRRRRTVFRRTIAPAAAAFQHMNDTADDAAIVCTLNTTDIRRQMRFDPPPLFLAQPKQVLAHDPPFQNRIRIVFSTQEN